MLQAAALATKWWEPARDALDTMVLSSARMHELEGYQHTDFMPFDPSIKVTPQCMPAHVTPAMMAPAHLTCNSDFIREKSHLLHQTHDCLTPASAAHAEQLHGIVTCHLKTLCPLIRHSRQPFPPLGLA